MEELPTIKSPKIVPGAYPTVNGDIVYCPLVVIASPIFVIKLTVFFSPPPNSPISLVKGKE
jgi:hypothetical protein